MQRRDVDEEETRVTVHSTEFKEIHAMSRNSSHEISPVATSLIVTHFRSADNDGS